MYFNIHKTRYMPRFYAITLSGISIIILFKV